MLDRYLAKAGYSGQMAAEKQPADAPNNLYDAVPGNYSAHGRFDTRARSRDWEMISDEHRPLVAAVVLVGLVGLHLLARKLKI